MNQTTFIPEANLVHPKAFYVSWKTGRAGHPFANEARCKIYHAYLCRFRERYGIKIHGYALDGSTPRLSGLCPDLKTLQLYLRTVNSSFVKKNRQIFSQAPDKILSAFEAPDVIVADDFFELWSMSEKKFADPLEKKLPNHLNWNSFHHYAYAREDELLDEPFWYLMLGHKAEERARRYVRLLQQVLSSRGKTWFGLWPIGGRFSFMGQPEWLKFRLSELALLEEHERRGRLQKLLCLGM